MVQRCLRADKPHLQRMIPREAESEVRRTEAQDIVPLEGRRAEILPRRHGDAEENQKEESRNQGLRKRSPAIPRLVAPGKERRPTDSQFRSLQQVAAPTVTLRCGHAWRRDLLRTPWRRGLRGSIPPRAFGNGKRQRRQGRGR